MSTHYFCDIENEADNGTRVTVFSHWWGAGTPVTYFLRVEECVNGVGLHVLLSPPVISKLVDAYNEIARHSWPPSAIGEKPEFDVYKKST